MTKPFARFARAEKLTAAALQRAVLDAERGFVDADLGGGLVKLRVARPGQGKRGGFRTLLAYRTQVRAIFLFGFAKNELENISNAQLADLKNTARDLLKRRDNELDQDVAAGRLLEVCNDEVEEG